MNEQVTEHEMTTADVAYGSERPVTEEQMAPISHADAVRAAQAGKGDARQTTPAATPLFAADAAQNFRSRWTDVQAGFVDEPRKAVERADALVAETMKRLAETFAQERSKLEGQWDKGSDISTEDLRVALQRYRSFFDRLLAV